MAPSLLALIALLSLAPSPPPELHLAAGTFRPLSPATPSPVWFSAPAVAAKKAAASARVLTREPLSADQRRLVEASGAEILDVFPPRGYRVRVAAESKAALRRLPFVEWLGALPAHFKVDPELSRRAAASPRASPSGASSRRSPE